MSEDAVLRAQKKGLDVHVGTSSMIDGKYDAIIAFGVLEHVSSPTSFLRDLSKCLSDAGEVIVGQPMQDVPSYDLFLLTIFTTSA